MPAHLRIKARREIMQLSQEQLAERLRPYWPGITFHTISKIERGVRIVKADELPLLAAALECHETDLLDPKPTKS